MNYSKSQGKHGDLGERENTHTGKNSKKHEQHPAPKQTPLSRRKQSNTGGQVQGLKWCRWWRCVGHQRGPAPPRSLEDKNKNTKKPSQGLPNPSTNQRYWSCHVMSWKCWHHPSFLSHEITEAGRAGTQRRLLYCSHSKTGWKSTQLKLFFIKAKTGEICKQYNLCLIFI